MFVNGSTVILGIFGLMAGSGCSSPEETRFFNFDPQSTPRQTLKVGWSFFEQDAETNTYSWATGKRSVIEVVSRADGDRSIRFRGMPFVFPGAPQQTVKISVNDRDLTTIGTLPGFRVYNVVAPHAVWRRGANTVSFDFAYAESPKAKLDSNDLRPLAVAFDWLEITPSREPKEAR